MTGVFLLMLTSFFLTGLGAWMGDSRFFPWAIYAGCLILPWMLLKGPKL